MESLAAAYANAIDQAERLSGSTIRNGHVVVCGGQNALFCQFTADRTERTVLVGPVEATPSSNVLVRARSARWLTGGLAGPRAVVARTFVPTEYRPR